MYIYGNGSKIPIIIPDNDHRVVRINLILKKCIEDLPDIIFPEQ